MNGKTLSRVCEEARKQNLPLLVACEVKLREEYQLRDGDVIEVEVAD